MFSFGKPPFEVADGYGIEVSNLEATRNWYKEKLGFRDAPEVDGDDSGRPFCGLKLSDDGTPLSLVEKNPMQTKEQDHVIFYSGNLDKSREWMIKRGVPAGQIVSDSGGNRFFKIQDADGNTIEVCVEP
jgi:catechol 2,3-dioxygenase-like lactoylglutathione lyase family enzyme